MAPEKGRGGREKTFTLKEIVEGSKQRGREFCLVLKDVEKTCDSKQRKACKTVRAS